MNALIDVVFPVFAIIAVGFLAGRTKVLGPDSAAALNRFVYYFALPPVLFVFPARQPIADVLNWPFIAAFLGGALLAFLLLLALNRLWLRRGSDDMALFGLNSVYPNTSYMGVPLFLTAFGPDGAMPAIIATVFGITLMVGGAIAALEATRAEGPTTAKVIGQVAATLSRNPLLIASALGIAASFAQLPIPAPIGNYLDLMASAAGPAALFALGLSLYGRRLRGDVAPLSCLLVLKLIAQPALTYVLAFHVFEMTPFWASGAVLLSALPVGAVAFVVAQKYDRQVGVTSSAMVLSTLLSVPTLSVLLILFGAG